MMESEWYRGGISHYPYHWGIDAAGKVPTPSGPTVMGVQRISVFQIYTDGGATAFKLGSILGKTAPRTMGFSPRGISKI
ncbi:MAG: hypothetical protein CM1200mP24_03200 [Gammaproteobacteria bacterium]|nr:MAG: hypothetical protein CM1200mP24_03200 [Gammaproteobacteria bacterium]